VQSQVLKSVRLSVIGKIRPMRIALGLLLSLALHFPATGLAAEPPEELTLAQAVRIATDHSPSLAAFAADREATVAEKKKALAAFFPAVDVTANQGLLSGGNQRSASSLSLQLTETFFDSGISILNYDSSALRKQISELSYQNARDLLALSLAQQFARYSLNQNLLEVQQAQFDTVKKQHTTIEALYRQGVKTRKDFLRFTTELRRNEIDLISARTAIERSKVEIKRLMGWDNGAPMPTQFKAIAVDVKSVEKIPQQAPDISGHFQYRIAKLQSELFGNDVSVASRKFWPQLSLTAGAGYVEDDYLRAGRGIDGFSGSNWNMLATVKWNLMDWGIRRRDIQIAGARKIQQERQIRDTLNTFAAENEKLLLGLQQIHANFKLSQELLDLETKTYEFLRVEYQNGKVSYLDLIVGLRDLLSAKVKLFSSYFELQELLFQFRYHEGRLYETFQEA
jgi:outer membrane protein